jgi:6-phosphogluconolactonase
MLTGEPRVFSDDIDLARAATKEFLTVVRTAIAERGSCSVALSGGHTPELMYRLWRTEFRAEYPWEKIEYFWGDERYVPHNDPRSNYRMTSQALLSGAPIPAAHIHPMLTGFPDPQEAATDYERTLRSVLPPSGPAFDIVFLGLGEEGHTASLFPGSPALTEAKRWVVSAQVPAEPPLRLTLTLPLLNRARNIYFLVAGAAKRDIIRAMRKDPAADHRYPAAMVHGLGSTIWFLDSAAYASDPEPTVAVDTP